MRSFLAVCILLTLCFANFFTGNFVTAQVEDSYSMQLQGFVWNHAILSALIIPGDNESWWDPSFMNDTIRAIGQWNNAIENFVANYSDYSYLSNLQINYEISNEIRFGYDLYIRWIESSASNMSDEVGLTQTFVRGDSTILNCTLSLAVETNHGVALRTTDMQNIALHELGHGLGLGHSNYTGDLMYSLYRPGDSPIGVSTLNVYGVSMVFAWMLDSSNILPISRWFKQNTVTLPSQITYTELAVSPSNMPQQTLADNVVVQFLVLMVGLFLHPEIAVPVGLVIIIFALVLFLTRRKKSKTRAAS